MDFRRVLETAIGLASGGALVALVILVTGARVGPVGPAGPAGPTGPVGPVGTSSVNSGQVLPHNTRFITDEVLEYVGPLINPNGVPQIWLSSETDAVTTSPVTSITLLNTSMTNKFGELAFQTRQGELTDTWALAVDPQHNNSEAFVIRNRGQLAATFEEDLGFRVERGVRLGAHADIRADVNGEDLLMLRALPTGNLQLGQVGGYNETTIFGGGDIGVAIDRNGFVRTVGIVLIAPDGGQWLMTVGDDGAITTTRFQ